MPNCFPFFVKPSGPRSSLFSPVPPGEVVLLPETACPASPPPFWAVPAASFLMLLCPPLSIPLPIHLGLTSSLCTNLTSENSSIHRLAAFGRMHTPYISFALPSPVLLVAELVFSVLCVVLLLWTDILLLYYHYFSIYKYEIWIIYESLPSHTQFIQVSSPFKTLLKARFPTTFLDCLCLGDYPLS